MWTIFPTCEATHSGLVAPRRVGLVALGTNSLLSKIEMISMALVREIVALEPTAAKFREAKTSRITSHERREPL